MKGRLSFLLLMMMLCLIPGCSRPRIDLAVASQPNINPDYSGRPSPVILKMFELRNDLAFKQSEFQMLFDQPLQALGADLVAADELVFIPGEARKIRYQPAEETKYIGIVAGFRQMDRSQWRFIKPVDPKKATLLAFELNDATIIVIPEKQAEKWDPEEAVRAYQQRALQTNYVPSPAPGDGSVSQPQENAAGSTLPAMTPLW